MRRPSAAVSAARGAWRWVSLPAETCRMAVSTSANPWTSNHARTVRDTAARAWQHGHKSACRAADHHGEGGSLTVIAALSTWAAKRWHAPAKWVCCGPKTASPASGRPLLSGPDPEHQEQQL